KEGYRLFGPLLGAGLFAWLGGGAVAVLDAVSFVVAAVIISTIRVVEHRPERTDEHWWAEMSGGVRHLVHERLVRHVLVSFALTILVLGFTEASIYALLDFYDKPVTFAGVLVSVQGVGAIAGGLTTSLWVRRIGEPATVAVGLLVLALSAGAVGLTSSLWVVAVAFLLVGYTLPMLFVAFMTLLQRRTPQRLMGRVSAAVETLLGAPQAISIAVGAGLVALIDFHLIFGIVGAVTAIGAGYLVVALRAEMGHAVPALDEAAEAPPEPAGPLLDVKVDGAGPALPS
ncbi:MAG TPA: MFS transporter, partial [Marmoricola sp.]|nr:MFS transporter [Marmoricola sp.]